MKPIDADELRSWLVKAGRFLKLQDDKRSAAHAVGKIIAHIDKIPAVDAVPVIRCRECKHMRRDNVGIFCKVWNGYNGCGEAGFCSYGEKREPQK